MTTAFSKVSKEQASTMIDYLIEGNGSVDLAHMYLEKLNDQELADLTQEIADAPQP